VKFIKSHYVEQKALEATLRNAGPRFISGKSKKKLKIENGFTPVVYSDT